MGETQPIIAMEISLFGSFLSGIFYFFLTAKLPDLLFPETHQDRRTFIQKNIPVGARAMISLIGGIVVFVCLFILEELQAHRTISILLSASFGCLVVISCYYLFGESPLSFCNLTFQGKEFLQSQNV